ncbi:hypothetical protein F2P81_006097 [Scophthalmus maximus]|uniref:Uncharacterized protein n=1 Tax=Scophthalmus maximus TaxID=52904 RepID=A0A6A4TBG3_SCOMX|nr:hypothetical protein F2P81_006097 [Scophthalmus maximus]
MKTGMWLDRRRAEQGQCAGDVAASHSGALSRSSARPAFAAQLKTSAEGGISPARLQGGEDKTQVLGPRWAKQLQPTCLDQHKAGIDICKCVQMCSETLRPVGAAWLVRVCGAGVKRLWKCEALSQCVSTVPDLDSAHDCPSGDGALDWSSKKEDGVEFFSRLFPATVTADYAACPAVRHHVGGGLNCFYRLQLSPHFSTEVTVKPA